MILRMCPRCGRPTPLPRGYCEQCQGAASAEQEQARAASAKKYNAKRDKNREAFYKTSEWFEFSRGLMSSRKYQCQAGHEGCTHLAVEVHHKIPISKPEGWERRLDPTNCDIVCLNCHNFAHNRFQRRRGPRPRG